jgi:DNA-binding Xre family transcriptional regulator
MRVRIDRLRFRGAVSEFGQTRLAEAIHTKQPNISRLLKNLDKLTFERFNEICETMQLNPQEFLVFEDGKAENKKVA